MSIPVKKIKAKKVIIIGATSGIGRELALIYASKGCMVGISGRREEHLISLKEKFPDNLVIEKFDVTGKENIIHLQNLIEKLDGMDVLIYNSGFGEMSKTLEWEIENQTTQVNVNGFLELICFGYNYFCNQGYGQLAGTSSIASIKGSSRATAYAASKAFMSNYLEGLYLKAKNNNKNISVTDIQPGFVDTALIKGAGIFWVAKASKAAYQIYNAIEGRRKRVYITKRWWIIAKLLEFMPNFIYNSFG